jgi:hypothetical protein
MWGVRRLIQDHDPFFRQRLFVGKRCVWGRVVMVQDPLVGWQFWPHTTNPLSQKLEMKLLVDSLTRWDKPSVHYPFALKETNQHCHDFWFWHLRFLVAGWSWGFPLNTLLLCLRVILKNPIFIPSNDLVIFLSLNKNFMLILCSKYLSNIFLTSYSNTTSVKAQQLCTR